MVLSDSQLQPIDSNAETQLPCSPSQLPNTDVAAETLKNLDAHDKAMEEKVGNVENHVFKHISLLHIYLDHRLIPTSNSGIDPSL